MEQNLTTSRNSFTKAKYLAIYLYCWISNLKGIKLKKVAKLFQIHLTAMHIQDVSRINIQISDGFMKTAGATLTKGTKIL